MANGRPYDHPLTDILIHNRRVYFKQLADLDRSALEQLVTNSIADVRRRYG